MSKTVDRENLTLSSAVVSVKVKLEKGHSYPHPNPQGRAPVHLVAPKDFVKLTS